VHPDTSAARAGLQPGDVILSVNDIQVMGANSLADLLAGVQAQGAAILRIRRGDRIISERVSFG
jgi:S1-C subfamily serine protease